MSEREALLRVLVRALLGCVRINMYYVRGGRITVEAASCPGYIESLHPPPHPGRKAASCLSKRRSGVCSSYVSDVVSKTALSSTIQQLFSMPVQLFNNC